MYIIYYCNKRTFFWHVSLSEDALVCARWSSSVIVIIIACFFFRRESNLKPSYFAAIKYQAIIWPQTSHKNVTACQMSRSILVQIVTFAYRCVTLIIAMLNFGSCLAHLSGLNLATVSLKFFVRVYIYYILWCTSIHYQYHWFGCLNFHPCNRSNSYCIYNW